MNYNAKPLSRKRIRDKALAFRRLFNAEDEPRFDVIWALETIEHWAPGFYYEIEDDSRFDDLRVQAETDFGALCVRIRSSVYDRACAGDGCCRMTIGHELGHVVLIGTHGLVFCRRGAGDNVEAYRDPEWQADCFAGELLAPAHIVRRWTAREVARFCGITLNAAGYQLRKYKEEGGFNAL